MKQITFLRHAKSDWTYDFLNDVDRPLNERGYKEAYAMSQWMVNEKMVPDALFTSTAMRALSTALIFARAFNFTNDKVFLDASLYEANIKTKMNFIKLRNNQFNHILIAGHNPSTTSICNYLLKAAELPEVPTCGLVSIYFDVKNWNEINTQAGTLNFIKQPNDLKK